MCDGLFGSDPTVVAQSSQAPDWLTQFYKDNANELTSQYRTAQNIYNANNNYQPYAGPRQQGFVNDQSRAHQMVRDNIGVGQGQLSNATSLANRAATSYGDNGGAPFVPGSIQTQNYTGQHRVGDMSPSLLGPITQIAAQQSADQGNFNSAAAQSLMNPYTDSVMKGTLAEMDRQNQQGVQQDALSAAKNKAFGGSGSAIMAAERARNYGTQQANTIAGLNNQNFAQAQNQFNVQNQLRQQNQQFNVGTKLTADQANQGAIIQGALADQASRNNMKLAGEQASLAAAGFNRDTFNQNQDRSFQTQVQNQNMGLQAWNANRDQFNTDQNRALQSGALNLQAAPLAQQMGMQDANNLLTIGNQQQQFGQQGMDLAYQDFARQKQHPYENFAFLQSALRGANYNPMAGMTNNSTTTGGGPSPVSQVAGLAMTGLGMYNAGFFG